MRLADTNLDGVISIEELMNFIVYITKHTQGLNSIEFQQDVQQGFQQSTLHSVVLDALLKITLNSLLKLN